MQITNPLRMDQWKIERLLAAILLLQCSFLGLYMMDGMGIRVPLLRPLVGVLYLAFVPGILALRIFRIRTTDAVHTLLLSAGLSLALTFLIGILINAIYPVLGVDRPFTESILVYTMGGMVVLLAVLAYVRDRDYASRTTVDLGSILTIPNVLLCMLPACAVLGTLLVNYYQLNSLLMVLILLIAAAVVVVGTGGRIPRESYPLAIFAISLALLFHTSLITPYLWGWDIVDENYYANLVIEGGFWDSTQWANVNACLSIVIFAPFYSIIPAIPLTWVFKVVYPGFYALTAVALYEVFKSQMDEKFAFLSSFLFVGFFEFYLAMFFLTRQQLAELFFALILLVMVQYRQSTGGRTALLILFGFSLITSHYGLAFIFLLILIAAWIVYTCANTRIAAYSAALLSRMRGLRRDPPPVQADDRGVVLNLSFISLYTLFTLLWYTLVSGSSVAFSITTIALQIVQNLAAEFLNPTSAQGLLIIVSETASPIHDIGKGMILAVNVLIGIGILCALLLDVDDVRLRREFNAFAIAFFILNVLGVAVPYFASNIGIERFYHITLMVLAPFFVIGGATLVSIIQNACGTRRLKRTRNRILSADRQRTARCFDRAYEYSTLLLGVFLAVFLLFNSGFVYEALQDNPNSIALSNLADYPKYNDREYTAAGFLRANAVLDSNNRVMTDDFRGLLLRLFGVSWDAFYAFPVLEPVDLGGEYYVQEPIDTEGDYIFIGTYNIQYEKVSVTVYHKAYRNLVSFGSSGFLRDRSKIYDNGGAQTFL